MMGAIVTEWDGVSHANAVRTPVISKRCLLDFCAYIVSRTLFRRFLRNKNGFRVWNTVRL